MQEVNRRRKSIVNAHRTLHFRRDFIYTKQDLFRVLKWNRTVSLQWTSYFQLDAALLKYFRYR